MLKTVQDWIAQAEAHWEKGRHLPVPDAETFPPQPSGDPARGEVWILAPHPDDECLMAPYALDWQAKTGGRVVVIPLSLGSDPQRQAARREELVAACRVLGAELHWAGDLEARVLRPGFGKTDEGADLLTQLDQRASLHPVEGLLFPHAADGHPAHQATFEIGQALAGLWAKTLSWTAQTEYWFPLEKPNVLWPVSTVVATRCLAALLCHQGELQRNPYQATYPAWLMDNVRRGAERLTGNGPGQAAPGFPFGQLLTVTRLGNPI